MDGAGVQMVKIRGKFHVEQKLETLHFRIFVIQLLLPSRHNKDVFHF